MYEQSHPPHVFGKAVLVTILALGALVALNPPSDEGPHAGSPLVLQTAEVA